VLAQSGYKETISFYKRIIYKIISSYWQNHRERGRGAAQSQTPKDRRQNTDYKRQFLSREGQFTKYFLHTSTITDRTGYRANRSFFQAFLEIGIILFIIISCIV
jgi:hypothetical protein